MSFFGGIGLTKTCEFVMAGELSSWAFNVKLSSFAHTHAHTFYGIPALYAVSFGPLIFSVCPAKEGIDMQTWRDLVSVSIERTPKGILS